MNRITLPALFRLLAGCVLLFVLYLPQAQAFEDRDYSNEINWPAATNPACPKWKDGQTVNITHSMTLPAGCLYERVTLRIAQPNINFNCNGAIFNGLKGRRSRRSYFDDYNGDELPQSYAFLITGAEARTPVKNVTVRNCQIINYVSPIVATLNLSDETKASLRNSSSLEDYLRGIAPSNIRVINSKILNAHQVGVYVNRYVTRFLLKNSSIKGAGSPGLYLEAGTRQATVTRSTLEGNGFSTYDTSKHVRLPRLTEASRREGIAVDASSNNLITRNTFRDNADGGVYLYKNCWEHANDPQQLPRYDGADNNRITLNQFDGERVGVWVAERADRDLTDFECGDPLVYQDGDARYYRDHARNNKLARNTFTNTGDGIRVMDDDTLIKGNTFSGTAGYDIDVGSWVREKIGDPVNGTRIGGNTLSRRGAIRFQFGSD